MLNLTMLIYVVALFYVLVPGMFLSIPSSGSKKVVALTHAIIFAVIFKLTHKMVWKLSMQMSGFQNAPAMPGMLPKEGFFGGLVPSSQEMMEKVTKMKEDVEKNNLTNKYNNA